MRHRSPGSARAAAFACLALLAAGCERIAYTPPPPADGGLPDATPPDIERSATPPAPIVGGGLLVTDDGRHAIAADLDRDVIWIVDLDREVEHGRIALEPGDQPNRLAADSEDRVHVALRRGGAIVAIDPEAPALLRRTAICPAPRGVAYDPARDALYVACLHGELLELDPATHAERRRVRVAPDLRDVVVDGARVLVSTFRSAEVFAVSPDGAVEALRAAVPSHPTGLDGAREHLPRVAWRMAADPRGGARLLHQRHRAEALPAIGSPGQYYSVGRCSSGVLHPTVATIDADPTAAPPPPLSGGLMVDLAIGFDGRLAVAEPSGRRDQWVTVVERDGCFPERVAYAEVGVVAVAWSGALLITFQREPAAVFAYRIHDGDAEPVRVMALPFDAPRRADTGHRLFHAPTSSDIACASCHPEGGEDGHVWVFEAFGPRRTQTLHGGVSQRAPFHWSGDLADFPALMDEVFVARMGAEPFHPAEAAALMDWLDTLPTLPPGPHLDAAAVARGRAVFDAIGCRDCHFTDGTVDPDSHDVGTGEPLQVPSLLGVAHRLPLMHDGCAASLTARFDPACGGGEAHGRTADLSEAEQRDLVTYLESL